MQSDAIRQLMEFYPRIYFACHRRHVRDPKSKRVLSAHQGSILDHLDEREPLMLLKLAQHMGVTPSTMSLEVEQLVRKGYVTRERDARDGRRLMLRLSASGVRVRETNSVLDSDRVGKMLARLSQEELAAGIGGLALLAKAALEQTEELEKKRKPGRGRLPVEESHGGDRNDGAEEIGQPPRRSEAAVRRNVDLRDCADSRWSDSANHGTRPR